MLWSTDAGGSRGQRSGGALPSLQPTQRRLIRRVADEPRAHRPPPNRPILRMGRHADRHTKTKPRHNHADSTVIRKLFSVGDSRAIIRRHMRELLQIESSSEHACGQPASRRWEVLEPISGRWSWLTVFDCCELVHLDPIVTERDDDSLVQRAA